MGKIEFLFFNDIGKMTEAVRSLTPQIADPESPQGQHSCIRVHFEFPSPECQRYWDEVVQTQGVITSYDPKDDTYVVPLPFPLDVLKALNGTVVESQNPAK